MGVPGYLTRLVGRADELDALERHLAVHRLVSLVGPGGAGKTRLASEALRQLGVRFVDGTVFVPLADLPVTSPAITAVAAAADVQPVGDQALVDALVERFDGSATLLVLDNVEHVLVDAATLASTLLAAEGLTILTTGREPLGVPGEVVLRVEPLEQPPASASADEALATASVELLVDRLRTLAPDRSITDVDVGDLASVARKVEGLPLALELAAARAGTLGPQELLRLIDVSLTTLGTTSRVLPARHRSLQAAIGWSVDLLSEPARRLLGACGLLTGGGGSGLLAAMLGQSEVEAVDVVDELVRASFLQVIPVGAGPNRYRLLEPVRQLQAEALDDERAAEVGRAIFDHCVRLARAANGAPGERECESAITELSGDWANAVTMAHWALDADALDDDDVELLNGLFVVAATGVPVAVEAQPGHDPVASELIDLYRRAAALPGADPIRRSALARHHAMMCAQHGRPDEADQMILVAIDLGAWAGDDLSVAAAHEAMAQILFDRGELAAAEHHLDLGDAAIFDSGPAWLRRQQSWKRAAIAVQRGHLDIAADLCLAQLAVAEHDEVQQAVTSLHLAEVRTEQGRWSEAVTLARRVSAWAIRAGNDHIRGEAALSNFDAQLGAGEVAAAARTLESIGIVHQPLFWHLVDEQIRVARLAALTGDVRTAAVAAADAVTTARLGGDVGRTTTVVTVAGRVALAMGDADEAAGLLREAVSTAGVVPYASALAQTLDGLVVEASRASDRKRARVLGAAVEHLRSWTGCARGLVPDLDELRRTVSTVQPSDELFEPGTAVLTPDGLTFVLAPVTVSHPTVGRPRSGWDSLTRSELVVAQLVAQGLRSRDIAQQLYVSPRTVHSHLAHIFTKLGITTRTQLAVEVVAHQPD